MRSLMAGPIVDSYLDFNPAETFSYLYVSNSPTIYIDPTGLEKQHAPWDNGAPGYRLRIYFSASEDARKELGAFDWNWAVHHTYMQGPLDDAELRKWFYENMKRSVHDTEFLRIVPCYVHDEIGKMQSAWWLPYRQKLADELGVSVDKVSIGQVIRSGSVDFNDYKQFSDELDQVFSDYMLYPGFKKTDVTNLYSRLGVRTARGLFGDAARKSWWRQFGTNSSNFVKKYGLGAAGGILALLALANTTQAFETDEWDSLMDQYHKCAGQKAGTGSLSPHRRDQLSDALMLWMNKHDIGNEMQRKAAAEALDLWFRPTGQLGPYLPGIR
jgi:hypothetical protein